ncbi:hypothetical protein PHYBLDRAFT_62184 [Phycomyces blakesleeanus NRRL 1555(-)]|uniref:Uncharacterized protein n=1 Tax=Phycomyces blakesleeanus (strain ATCC 8743b / DSM 1359 / FGSC 10004 / NBRC 33097 / NRRL 1555) TaxID=763407 RepID=A0A162Y8W5_PHYB8|nr:hypothetical protein PHYBLDRAFT_62184 [Phycomyces blakesleeanus NRRL 1555(-)]OAD79055.1 hypothetical protein PHYBLDRAFT_62184 [Phycomyces blakesleeanus NRRL 1555(-)]|eukprot:XP_018297095.1 hypothetical protein PHYBLDRAFT_62184 [Phycomyces blakesleeanus NRRL 1555(-)]
MSCLNRDGLNDFQFAPLILSVSQDFSGPLTKTYTLGGFTKCHWSLSRSSFLIIHRLLFSTDRQIIFYRQCHCILCLSTLLFSELSVNKQAKKACLSKQWNTVGVNCTRGGPMDVGKE